MHSKSEQNDSGNLIDNSSFTPKNNQYSFFKSKELFIQRNRIPQELIVFINELRIQFPQGYFYLTGSAPANLLNKIQPNDYDILILNVALFEIQSILDNKKIYSELRSHRHPILYCQLNAEINIDFTAKFLKSNQSVEELLKSDYYERDFNLNAFYLEFTDAAPYKILDFYTQPLLRNTIASIPDSIISFQEDPSRLFRLAKLSINYPSFSFEDSLFSSLLKLRPYWFGIFDNYFQKNTNNMFRLGQSIRKLFLRYTLEQINLAFYQLRILSLFTGNTYTACQEACEKIPKTLSKELKFQTWIITNSLQYFKKKKRLYMPLEEYLTPVEMMNCNTIEDFLYSKNPSLISHLSDDLLNLLHEFNLEDSDPTITLYNINGSPY
jgi:hypothetical protein